MTLTSAYVRHEMCFCQKQTQFISNLFSFYPQFPFYQFSSSRPTADRKMQVEQKLIMCVTASLQTK